MDAVHETAIAPAARAAAVTPVGACGASRICAGYDFVIAFVPVVVSRIEPEP